MIVSVSRRTDIPALYGQWFFRRLEAKEAYQINPFNRKQVHRVPLDRDAVDAFVFWTKNPGPFLQYLPNLEGYAYYFHFTLTPYGKAVEPAFKDKENLLNTFKTLASRVGAKRVIWRYDPIIISDTYDEAWHIERFKYFANNLQGSTHKVIVSFVDFYKKAQSALDALNAYDPTRDYKKQLIRTLNAIADQAGMSLELCSESFAMENEGIRPSKCVDPELIETIGGTILNPSKDPNQRNACGCVISKDIGMYDTCTLGCVYCYAVRKQARTSKNRNTHDPNSPVLFGHLRGDETMYDVNLKKYR